jgi:hypothetical protein
MGTPISSRIYDALAGLPRAVGDGAALGAACLFSYLLITRILGQAYFVCGDEELLGGLWAVIATIFVYRHTYRQSVSAADLIGVVIVQDNGGKVAPILNLGSALRTVSIDCTDDHLAKSPMLLVGVGR